MENAVRWQYKLDLNERIFKFVEEHEEKVNKVIRPLPPKVMVFVLPKEFRYGSIILPDQKQHKPVYEGVVVRIFEPYWRQKTVSKPRPTAEVQALIGNEEYVENWRIDSIVNVGDHVLFPHWVGTPVPFMDYDMHKFRLIDHTEFLAKLSYEQTTREDVRTLLDKAAGEQRTTAQLGRMLMDQFVIVPRDEWSRTTSGTGE